MHISYLIKKNKSLKYLLEIILFLLISFIRIMRNSASNKSTATAILSLHKLGDSVFTIPAIKEIMKNRGQDCYLFCFEETKPIFTLFFREESLITFKHSDFILDDRIAKSIVRKKLGEIKPSTIYDLTGSIRSASILFPYTGNCIIGTNENYFKTIYTDFIPKRTDPHLIDIYLDVISSTIPGRENLKEFPIQTTRDGYLLIHPFAGWAAKEWNLTKFIKLAEHLNEHYEVIIVSPPNKINEDISEELKFLGIRLVETETTSELIEVINNCSMIISNDSGPVYIANIIGKPTFSIYGPTNPKFSVPYGQNHRYFRKVIKCSPGEGDQYCFTDAGRNGCPSIECMNLISLTEIEKKLIPFIEELNIKPKEISK